MRKPSLNDLVEAAMLMDWGQVVCNGGPPCFHWEGDGKYCGRAARWAGHDARSQDVGHQYLPLSQLLAIAAAHGRNSVQPDAETGPPRRGGFLCAAWKKIEEGPLGSTRTLVYRCDLPEGHDGQHVDNVLYINWPDEESAEEYRPRNELLPDESRTK
jgi:hypothetical protein